MRRIKLAAIWVVAFFGLFLFSGAAFNQVTGWGTERAYAQTISSKKGFKNFRNFVEVNGDKEDNGLLKKLGGKAGDKMICSVTPLQAAELDAFFQVKEFDIKVNGQLVTIARVSDRHLTAKQLKDFLKASDESLDCKVIGRAHVFFLPVIPQIS